MRLVVYPIVAVVPMLSGCGGGAHDRPGDAKTESGQPFKRIVTDAEQGLEKDGQVEAHHEFSLTNSHNEIKHPDEEEPAHEKVKAEKRSLFDRLRHPGSHSSHDDSSESEQHSSEEGGSESGKSSSHKSWWKFSSKDKEKHVEPEHHEGKSSGGFFGLFSRKKKDDGQ